MLVLTRRVGEEIVIGGTIRVAVVAINGRTVRLGVAAPASVPVRRWELLAGDAAGATTPRTGSSREGRPPGSASAAP
jgi:carbon storage regulator